MSRFVTGAAAFAALSFASIGLAQMMTPADRQATQQATERDYRQMLGQLGITPDQLRPGPSGDPKAPNAANHDEAKASPYITLPDPLVFNDGTKVTAPQQWQDKRRAEIIELFDREIYGRVPQDVPKVTWTIAKTTHGTTGDIATVTKQVVGHVDNSADPEITVDIDATLTTPESAAGPVPVIVEFGFNFGNRRPPGAPPGSKPAVGPTWQQQVLDRGYGFAMLTPTSYQADNGAGLTQGIIGLCNKGQPRKPDDWGALRAWAWGASRLVDYFETDPAVDAKQIGIEGLSRYGKATAVTMAYEPRLAIAFIGSSGQGGVKIMRRQFGEAVENVASSGEYHWMAGNYIKYAGPKTRNDLPIDAHELVALCAPRPVFISVGSLNVEGTWIDANGNFLGGKLASPVYELLGKKGLAADTLPPEKEGVIDGDIAFRMHEGGHTTGPNWPAFLDFAGRYLKAAGTHPVGAHQ